MISGKIILVYIIQSGYNYCSEIIKNYTKTVLLGHALLIKLVECEVVKLSARRAGLKVMKEQMCNPRQLKISLL